MEPVFFHHSTMLNLQIQDVVNGIGTIKFVLNALTDGTSMQIKYVFLLMISVHHMIVPQDLAHHASQDIFFQMEHVSWLILSVNHQLRPVLVLHASLDIS